MAGFMRRILKFAAGAVLALFAVAFLAGCVFELVGVNWRGVLARLFLGGAASFFVIHMLFRGRPFLYVFAHELSHVLAGLLTGAKVHSIYVSGKSGTTKTDKSNLMILLFPYVFPFFAALGLGLFWGLAAAGGDIERLRPYFYFYMGLALAHHLFYTATFLFRGQSDIRKTGMIFPALSFVALANVAVLAGILSSLFEPVSLARCLERSTRFFHGLLT